MSPQRVPIISLCILETWSENLVEGWTFGPHAMTPAEGMAV